VRNYGAAIRDCASALKLNPKSSKALYRSAVALKALERFEEALDSCTRCLTFDPENNGVLALVEQIGIFEDAKRRKAEEKVRKEKESKAEAEVLKIACQARHLTLTNISTEKEKGTNGAPHFDTQYPAPYTPTSPLILPVFLLYPQYNTSDFIAFFAEHTTFSDQLASIFPPPPASPPEWDPKREYTPGKVAVYVVTKARRLLKVGGKMTLADVILNAGVEKEGKVDGLEVRDGCLNFVVLPKGEVEKAWIEGFKKERDGGLTKAK